MGVTAAIGVGVLVAGSTTYSAVQGNQNRIAAQKQQDQNTANQNQLLQQAQTQEQQDQTQAQTTAAQQQAYTTQKSLAMASQGRSSTILTGPLGVTGAPPNTANKTLLGQ